MNNRITLLFVLAILFLSGCAAVQQKPLSITQDPSNFKNVRIGIAMTRLPKVEMQYPGAGCLLCLAAASIANSKLSSYTETLPLDDIKGLKNELADMLRKKGADVTVINEELNISKLPDAKTKGEGIASKDLSSFKEKYNVDKLLVVEIFQIGMSRSYADYFPTSDPKARFNGKGYLVNLSSNVYEWYQPIEILKSSDGSWDEPPKFPGLTNAYFQALELGKDEFIKPFLTNAN